MACETVSQLSEPLAWHAVFGTSGKSAREIVDSTKSKKLGPTAIISREMAVRTVIALPEMESQL